MNPDQERRWRAVVEAADAYTRARHDLGDADEQLAILRHALARWPDAEVALRLVRDSDERWVMELLPQLYAAATTTHRDLLLNRDIVGRLDPGWLHLALSPLVDETLATGDWESYRRLAELLAHLGQIELLARVVARAARSDDPAIADLADDFGAL